MPLPEGEALNSQIRAITESKMIPVVLRLFDRSTSEQVDKYLVGCWSVPRAEEILDYGETTAVVVAVRHQFPVGSSVEDVNFRHQSIAVDAWIED